jgi:hypothetical protein
MSVRRAATNEATAQASHADVLRMAAETLRYLAREVPRGPWRWAEPDLETADPLMAPHLHGPRRPAHDAALVATTATVGRQPTPLVGSNVIDPEIGEVLATLLELMAERPEDDATESADRVERAVVAVARSVLRAASRSAETIAIEIGLGRQP